MFDFSKTQFRASSWGNLMSEPREKAARERGELSKTCQKELIKIYNQVVYGREYDLLTKQMDKGVRAEPEAITLYSRVEKVLFYKNEQRLKNEWATGIPDIFAGESIYKAERVDDIKNSWNLETFMPKLAEEIEFEHECQLNVYFDLTGAKCGAIGYCLVSCPIEILMEEKRRLLYSMNVVTEESPEYVEAAKKLEKNLTFDDIDYRERVIKKMVYRNDDLIHQMKNKVPVLRNWLTDFHKKHMNLYPK